MGVKHSGAAPTLRRAENLRKPDEALEHPRRSLVRLGRAAVLGAPAVRGRPGFRYENRKEA